MSKTDRLFDARDLGRGLALLTRLPAPGADADRAAASAWTWPLVGLILGGIACGVAWAALGIGLPAGFAAWVAIAAMLLMTGGLHADGVADCADGFWGGHTAERRREIMHDSRIGSYGVVALIIVLGAMAVLLTELISQGQLFVAVLVPAMVSRAVMAVVMATMGFARDDGLAQGVGSPSKASAGVAVAIAVLAAVLLAQVAGVVVILAAGFAAFAVGALAQAKIGGQTGDVLGACQMLSSLFALAVLSVAT